MEINFIRYNYLAFAVVAAFSVPTFAMNRPALSGKRSVQGGSWIELQASTDKLTYTPGEPIQVTLKATNIQQKDAYLKFTSSQRYDFQIFRVGHKEPIYTWSADKNFLQATGVLPLKMAQRQTYQTRVGQEMLELTPGKYRLQAHLTNTSGLRARTIDFAVEPGTTQKDKRATLTATTAKNVYKVGEAVQFNCVLHNNLAKATTFTFRSGQTYDVFLKNAAGEAVWNWSANVRFLMVSRPITLAAGEKRKFTAQWDGQALPEHKITPGKYTVEAVYASDPQVRAQPFTIEIR